MQEVERIHDINEIYFPKLGWKFHIDPTAFKIGGFEIQWYGILITLGILLAIIYCYPKMRRFGVDSDRATDAIIGGMFGGIIGARIYYVIFNWSDYNGNIKEMLNTRNGGLAIYGGLIGAVLVGILICKIRKLKIMPMLDISVLGFLIGQGVGRWGNFVNQEAFGKNTDSILGMTGGRIQLNLDWNTTDLAGDLYQKGTEAFADYAVHPCFLYESLWCILGFIILSQFSKRRKYDGQIFLMYLVWYGIERFFVEGLRTDSLRLGSIRVSQLLSAVLVVVSVVLQIIVGSKRRREPEAFILYAKTEESRMLIEESRRKRLGLPPEDQHVSGYEYGDLDEEYSDDDDDDDYEDDDASGEDSEASDSGTDDEDEAADNAAEETGGSIDDNSNDNTSVEPNDKADEAVEKNLEQGKNNNKPSKKEKNK